MRYSVKPRDQTISKTMDFYPLQKPLFTPQKSWQPTPLRKLQRRLSKKTAEAKGDLVGLKIAKKITKVSWKETCKDKKKKTVQPTETY